MKVQPNNNILRVLHGLKVLVDYTCRPGKNNPK